MRGNTALPAAVDKHQLLRTYCTVVKLGSFNKAAQYLRLPSSSVSKNIKRLECQLNTQLIIRNTRSMSLTDAGALYYEKGSLVLAKIDELESEVKSVITDAQGKLRISLPLMIGERILLPVISEFIASNPDIRFELDYSHTTTNLIEEDFDVAFRTNDSLPDSNFFEVQLFELQPIYVASPAYLREHGAPSDLGDLVNHSRLTFTPDIKNHKQASMINSRINNHGRVLSNSYQSLITAAQSGCGIASIYDVLVREELSKKSLVQVLGQHELDKKKLSIIYRQRGNTSKKIQSFIDFLMCHPRLSVK